MTPVIEKNNLHLHLLPLFTSVL